MHKLQDAGERDFVDRKLNRVAWGRYLLWTSAGGLQFGADRRRALRTCRATALRTCEAVSADDLRRHSAPKKAPFGFRVQLKSGAVMLFACSAAEHRDACMSAVAEMIRTAAALGDDDSFDDADVPLEAPSVQTNDVGGAAPAPAVTAAVGEAKDGVRSAEVLAL